MSQACVQDQDHPLLSSNQNFSKWSTLARKYQLTYKCISSKAALVVLIWSFAINLLYTLLYQPANHYPCSMFIIYLNYFLSGTYGFNAILLCFYPLAGYLADVKFGRYKVLSKSLLYLILSLICLHFISIPLFPFVILSTISSYFIILLVIFAVVGVVLFIVININFVPFNANIIQFGIDQLFDSPGDHQSIFIYWYFWTYYAATFISQLGWNVFYMFFWGISYSGILKALGIMILGVSWITALLVLLLTSCIAWRKKYWFLKDRARINPYKLVYKISKFARQHKVPIRRSAFTYCEDEVPCGLNLGKEKYGGPYTTEQVEDVKAFYGILRILLATGPLYFLEISINRVFLRKYEIDSEEYYYDNFTYTRNYTYYKTCMGNSFFINPVSILLHYGVLTPFLIAASIPAYLLLIRPFINYYKPRMLKYIGFGILLMLISVFCTFLMDIVNIKECFINHRLSCHLDSLICIVEGSLHAFSCVLVYPALYQFICAQSPHSMKGLLIGLAFAIKGMFQLLAVIAVIIANSIRRNFYTCRIDYYLLNILVGIISITGFICAAKKYKLRERDEPCHVRRYVEEYYSKTEQEENYDYFTSTL